MKADRSETLSPLAFHLLVTLADGNKHGYAIIKAIEQRTGGTMRPRSGTLYATIQKLMDEGLVREISAGPQESQGPKRRYYKITAVGRRRTVRETERLAALVAAARSALAQ